MSAKIITKFTVATGDGIGNLMDLGAELARAKFQELVSKEILEKYISDHFAEKVLIEEVNSLSNQWLIVYADENPAGYVRITSKGSYPQNISGKRAIRIADFGILPAYSNPDVLNSLFQKSMQVCKGYEVIWLNEHISYPSMDFFIRNGFEKQEEDTSLDELPLPSVYLVRRNS